MDFLVNAGAGFCAGLVLSYLQWHPMRRRVWIPLAYLMLFSANLLMLVDGPIWLAGVLTGGGLVAPIAASGRARTALDIWLATVASAIVVLTFIRWTGAPINLYSSVLCGALFVATVWLYRRPVGETIGEWVIRIMYRMRAMGPGVEQLPWTGPVLVVANHTAYLDPCWIMICLPRDLTPIMFGNYFNIFGLHFYMKYIINAIPSGAGTVRRDAPELAEAVRRMDRGEGILIFPEGWVRRKEEETVRRFAQGPWRILRDRPATPVVACWIEGGWGSWSSFWNGPPFKGKRIDIRRPIDIGVSAPVVVDKETLADQHRTRELLRELVLNARGHLAACGLATGR